MWNKFGKIRWEMPVDLVNLNLDLHVIIQHNVAEVHPDDLYCYGRPKPHFGEELNTPARITLNNVFPKQPGVALDFVSRLRERCWRDGAEFVEYDAVRGQFTFRVPHFTKYSFVDIEETDNTHADHCLELSAVHSEEVGLDFPVRPLRVKHANLSLHNDPEASFGAEESMEASVAEPEPHPAVIDQHERLQLVSQARELEDAYHHFRAWEEQPMAQTSPDPSSSLFQSLLRFRATLTSGTRTSAVPFYQDFSFGMVWDEPRGLSFISSQDVVVQQAVISSKISYVVCYALERALVGALSAQLPDPISGPTLNCVLFALQGLAQQLARPTLAGPAAEFRLLVRLCNALFGLGEPADDFGTFCNRFQRISAPESANVRDERRRRKVFVCVENFLAESDGKGNLILQEFVRHMRRCPTLDTVDLIDGFQPPKWESDAFSVLFRALLHTFCQSSLNKEREMMGDDAPPELRLFHFFLLLIDLKLQDEESPVNGHAALQRVFSITLSDLLNAEQLTLAALMSWLPLARTAAKARSTQLLTVLYRRTATGEQKLLHSSRGLFERLLGPESVEELEALRHLTARDLVESAAYLWRRRRFTEAVHLVYERLQAALEKPGGISPLEAEMLHSALKMLGNSEDSLKETLSSFLELLLEQHKGRLTEERCREFLIAITRSSKDQAKGEESVRDQRLLQLVSAAVLQLISAPEFPFTAFVRGEFAQQVAEGSIVFRLTEEKLPAAVEQLYRKLYID